MLKRNQFIVALLCLATAFAACEQNHIDHKSDFEKSYKEWLNFKDVAGNSYRYTVTGSRWTGISWETVITITDGKVTRRHFKYTYPEEVPDNTPAEVYEWTENEEELNSHEQTPAARPLTLDEVYEQARTEWLIKKSNVKTYFEAGNNGLISSCGYVEENCADDCFRGIQISSIEPLD